MLCAKLNVGSGGGCGGERKLVSNDVVERGVAAGVGGKNGSSGTRVLLDVDAVVLLVHEGGSVLCWG